MTSTRDRPAPDVAVEPLTRGEWVDRRLRQAIITGEFEPGHKLVTETLAARWNVSPTPLREAYQRLAAEGLVDLVPQRGARVAEMSYADAIDVYGTRQLLEPHALRASMQHRDEAWKIEVQQRFAGLRVELELGAVDLVAFEEAHSAFHGALIARCDSPWLRRMIRMLQGHSTRYRLQSLEPRGGAEHVLHEHERLLAACIRGDSEAAVRLLTEHLQLTIDSIAAGGGEFSPLAASEQR